MALLLQNSLELEARLAGRQRAILGVGVWLLAQDMVLGSLNGVVPPLGLRVSLPRVARRCLPAALGQTAAGSILQPLVGVQSRHQQLVVRKLGATQPSRRVLLRRRLVAAGANTAEDNTSAVLPVERGVLPAREELAERPLVLVKRCDVDRNLRDAAAVVGRRCLDRVQVVRILECLRACAQVQH
jgi:hypothetical protein